ncbi:MAG: phosphopantothenoylcysteine synthase [Treponema sp.]|jgi:phosphopantothenate-cysteine ligase|nr:phosphopantothenoylcysteine synthase [Treponema sp.]
MNILITVGGTQERIDAVRSIANTSTGALGSRIAGCFAVFPEVEKIFYVSGPKAILPQTPKAQVVSITDTANLEAEVRRLLAGYAIDVIVHCMAVSDFRVSKVTTARRVASAGLEQAPEVDRGAKISSALAGDKLVLVLEETPKIIGLFKALAPDAILVGFKLMDGVTQAALIDTAYALLRENHCDFVLANDAQGIHGDVHVGYLIDAGKNVRRYDTKEDIAAGIAERVRRELL